MIRAALALALMFSAQVAVAQEELPPGYPPKMGEIGGTLGNKAVAWAFFDFSIGAFDASAWVDRDWDSHLVTLTLMGYTPDDPDDMEFRILVKGDFGKSFRTGKAEGPLRVSVLKGSDIDGAQLLAEGAAVDLVIDSLGPAAENSYLRHVTGSVTARVCPENWVGQSCKDLALRFDTDLQMGSAVPVTE